MAGSMRQLEERQLSCEVTLMRWSPRMDLLAVANAKGEVALHRLTWQRVWLLSPQKESDTLLDLAWRPDGKLLAILYKNSNLLCLVDIENKNIVHGTKLLTTEEITCITWLPLSTSDSGSGLICNKKLSPNGDFLPPLPNLNRTFNQEPEHREFLSNILDMIFIGQHNGSVMIYAFGMFYCGSIAAGNGPILHVSSSSNGIIWISWKDSTGIKINRLVCPLLEKNTVFLKVAQTQANIGYLMGYLSRTLMAISEAWETILLEMDEKLNKYAETNSPEGMAADFLELLMIGIPSPNLENFLLRDLTAKGLKKLGHSIEMCYSNIQKLVLKNLNSVGMALVYHLAEMRGMARLGGAYKLLGLTDENIITNAIHSAEAFLAKSAEIQQVIDHSMRDYKAFFRWLYVVILRLTDERIPSEVSRANQQELTFIAEFLRGFDKTEPCSGGRKGVNLEKLGQYLRLEPLQTCLTSEGSEWATLLDENRCLRDHPLIIKQDLSFSLLQSHKKVVNAVNTVFAEACTGLVHHFKSVSISLEPSVPLLSSQIITSEGNVLLVSTDVNQRTLRFLKIEYIPEKSVLDYKLTLIDMNQKQGSSTKPHNDMVAIDLQFYSQEYLSLLILNHQSCSSMLLQLPLKSLTASENKSNMISLSELIGAIWPKPFQGISVRKLAVSGERKVAAILSESNRKIRLLETEVEPEEEEEDEEEGFDDNMMDTTLTTPTDHSTS